MSLLEQYNIDISYVLIGIIAFCIILLLLIIMQKYQFMKLRKKYEIFMKGSEGVSIEKLIETRFDDIENLKTVTESVNDKINVINEKLVVTFEKMSIVKYDAFKETGGKLSFALSLLNEKNDGFILNCMHSSREGCYIYVKEIINGESFVMLSEEEKQSLEEAKNKNYYME